ncbi:hypothetical protein Droror1_Dr00019262 [Drosera rotundifolia]
MTSPNPQATVLSLTNLARAALSLGLSATILNSYLYIIDDNQRAVLFDGFYDVLPTPISIGEGRRPVVVVGMATTVDRRRGGGGWWRWVVGLWGKRAGEGRRPFCLRGAYVM